MKRQPPSGTWLGLLAAGTIFLSLSACVSKSNYEAKERQAAASAKEAEDAKKEVEQLKRQLSGDEQQVAQLKGSLGLAQSQAITDDQKTQLEEAKRAVQEAEERGKLLNDLQGKLRRMIDSGRLKVTTRHGRVVLQLHNDILFDVGSADLKADGKAAVAEVAATLKGVGTKRFQVAGHTDAEPITAETKRKFPTNWELSTARAIAVVKLLVADGVEASVLSAAGYGPFDPVASNATAEGQSRNRRIEITLVPNVGQMVAVVRDEAKK